MRSIKRLIGQNRVTGVENGVPFTRISLFGKPVQMFAQAVSDVVGHFYSNFNKLVREDQLSQVSRKDDRSSGLSSNFDFTFGWNIHWILRIWIARSRTGLDSPDDRIDVWFRHSPSNSLFICNGHSDSRVIDDGNCRDQVLNIVGPSWWLWIFLQFDRPSVRMAVGLFPQFLGGYLFHFVADEVIREVTVRLSSRWIVIEGTSTFRTFVLVRLIERNIRCAVMSNIASVDIVLSIWISRNGHDKDYDQNDQTNSSDAHQFYPRMSPIYSWPTAWGDEHWFRSGHGEVEGWMRWRISKLIALASAGVCVSLKAIYRWKRTIWSPRKVVDFTCDTTAESTWQWVDKLVQLTFLIVIKCVPAIAVNSRLPSNDSQMVRLNCSNSEMLIHPHNWSSDKLEDSTYWWKHLIYFLSRRWQRWLWSLGTHDTHSTFMIDHWFSHTESLHNCDQGHSL